MWTQTSANELTLRVLNGLFDVRIFWQEQIFHIRYGRSDESERVSFDTMSESEVKAHAVKSAVELAGAARAQLLTLQGEGS